MLAIDARGAPHPNPPPQGGRRVSWLPKIFPSPLEGEGREGGDMAQLGRI